MRNSINPYDISEFELIVDLACYGPGTRVLIGELAIQTDESVPHGTSNTRRKGKALAKQPIKLIDRYADISTLRPGMLVKTWHSGYVPIKAVGVKTIRTGDDPKTTLFRVPTYDSACVGDALLVTGGHSVLINNDIIKRIPRETRRLLKFQRPLVDGCQRVLAMNWHGAKQVPTGVVTEIYHIVLGDSSCGKGRGVNYGFWVNEGWLSESTTMKYFTRYGFKMLG